MHIGFHCMYVCIPQACTTHRGQKKVLDLLKLEWEMTVNITWQELNPSPLEKQPVLLAFFPTQQKFLNIRGALFLNYGRLNNSFYHFFLHSFSFLTRLGHRPAAEVIHLAILLRCTEHIPESAFQDTLEQAELELLYPAARGGIACLQ